MIGSPGYQPIAGTSPAKDGGNPSGCVGSAGPLTTDQRGVPRTGTCDVGAYEAPGGDLSIEAGHMVTIHNGFRVESGATVTIDIDPLLLP